MDKFIPAPPYRHKHINCGPYALAIINQMTSDAANTAICKSLRRCRRVQGMWRHEVERVSRGKYFKHRLKFKIVRDKPTLRSVADYLKPNRLYVVNVSHHYVTVDTRDWTMLDRFTDVWIPLDRSVWRLGRVKFVAEGPRFSD